MSSSFKLTLDTTAPLFAATLNAGFPVTGTREAPLAVQIEEALKEIQGYQIKIWGDVDAAFNEHIQATEEESDWVNITDEEDSFVKEFLLSEGDGAKAIFVRLRDDVWNETAAQELSVELDTTIPVLTITAGPSVPKVSKVSGKDTATFTFKASETIVGWEVRVVPTEGSNHGEGTVLVPEVAGAVEAETNTEVAITGAELQEAVGADGDYIIKVFGRNENGLWSL